MAQSTAVSLKYKVVRQNYDRLTPGITDGLHEVVTKAFARNLISLPTKNACLNDSSPTDQRAEKLVDTFLRKVQLDDAFFDTFVSILHEIPALSYLAKMLEDDLGGEGGSADVGERKSDIHNDTDKEYPTHMSGKRDGRHQSGGWSRKIAKAKQNSENVDSAVADLSTSSRPEKEESETHELVHLHKSAYNVPMLELYEGHRFSLGEGEEEPLKDSEDPQRLSRSSTSCDDSSNQADFLPDEKNSFKSSTQEAGHMTSGDYLVGAGLLPRVASSSSISTLENAVKNLHLENRHKAAEVAEKNVNSDEKSSYSGASPFPPRQRTVYHSKKNDQIANLKEENKELAQKLEKTIKEKEQTEGDLRSKEVELERVNRENESLRGDIQKVKDKMQNLKKRLADIEKENSIVRVDYEKRIAALQKEVDRLSARELKTMDEWIEVLKEKHCLELKVKTMEKNEAALKNELNIKEIELKIKLEAQERIHAAIVDAMCAKEREKYAEKKAQEEEDKRKEEETKRKDAEEKLKEKEEQRRNSELKAEELQRKLTDLQTLATMQAHK